MCVLLFSVYLYSVYPVLLHLLLLGYYAIYNYTKAVQYAFQITKIYSYS
jgi:hypothetical protein